MDLLQEAVNFATHSPTKPRLGTSASRVFQSNLAAVQNLIRTSPYWAQYMTNPMLAHRLLPALAQASAAGGMPLSPPGGFPPVMSLANGAPPPQFMAAFAAAQQLAATANASMKGEKAVESKCVAVGINGTGEENSGGEGTEGTTALETKVVSGSPSRSASESSSSKEATSD